MDELAPSDTGNSISLRGKHGEVLSPASAYPFGGVGNLALERRSGGWCNLYPTQLNHYRACRFEEGKLRNPRTQQLLIDAAVFLACMLMKNPTMTSHDSVSVGSHA